MTTYSIFIDESGSFQRTKNRSKDFVGGFVSKNFSNQIVEQKIVNSSNKTNSEIKDILLHFDHNKHMHFVPLHIQSDIRREFEKINFPIENTKKLVLDIFNSIEENVLFVFRSRGFVRYFLDPESVYTNILRSTLFQVVEDIKHLDDTHNNITINICIASKKAKERDYQPEEKFIKSLLLDLKEEISVFDNIRFNLEIQKAADNLGLRIADFFCGAMIQQFSSNRYLENYDIREYPVKHFSYNINSSLTMFESTYNYDNVLGIILALELITSFKNQELEERLKLEIKEVIDTYENEICEEIDNTLNQFIILDRDKYTRLDFYKSFIETINTYVYSQDNENFNKKIQLITQKYSIKILSHTGETDLELYHDYLNNLKENGYLIYKTRYLLLQEMLDNVLRAVPISFNSFDFQKFEEKINREFDNYKLIIPKDNKDIHDENMAKLEGTVGQMYAFLSDMYKISDSTKSNDFFQTSEILLINDLEYCIKDSNAWKKVIGYLISLYFKNRNLNECIKYFNMISESSSTNNIYNFSELDEVNEIDFILLQRLYICSLASKKENKKILNLEILRNNQNLIRNINTFPHFLNAKWIGYLYAEKGEFQTAIDLFEAASEPHKSDEFVIKIIKLSIKLLEYFLRIKVSNNENNIKNHYANQIEDKISELENEVPEIKNKLEMLGFNKDLVLNYESKDLFDLSTILPFTYS